MYTFLLLINILSAVSLVGLILLQRSEGGLGAAFGGGNAMGGATVRRNPLVRPTTLLALVFFGTCLGLAYVGAGQGAGTSVVLEALPEVISEMPETTPKAE